MENDYKRQLEQIESDVQNKKLEKAKLEERIRQLEEQKEQILGELEGLGITEVELDGFLEKEEKKIKEGIDRCKMILLEK